METIVIPQAQQDVQQNYYYAAHLLLKEERTADDTRELLMKRGLDETSASQIVDQLVAQISDAKRTRAKKDVLYGALWCGGGSLITAITYANAHGGGTYVVTWGAIIFGGIQLIRGLVNLAG